MGVDVRAYTRTGTLIGYVSRSTMSRQIEFNGVGALTFDAPLSERGNAAIIAADEPYLRVYENGVEQEDWYILDDDGDNLADGGGTARPVTISARGARALFEWAIVYPASHVPGGPVAGLNPEKTFTNATPGHIMLTLINAAQARGAIPMVTVNFTATTDSSGAPWAQTYSRSYSAGTDLLDVLDKMCDAGWCDSRMVGLQLRLYNPDTTLATDKPNVVLRLGQGVTDGPRKRTRRSIKSALLGVGDEGALVEVTSAPALTKYGRREGFEGRGGMTDLGTLAAVTQVSLNKQSDASESVTLVIEGAVPGMPRPVVDFLPGHYIRYDQRRLTLSQLEPLRVQSIAWKYEVDAVQISVELNDLWVDLQTKLDRRVDAIVGGSSANERVPQPAPEVDDAVAPNAPGSVTVTPSAYYPQRNAILPGRAAVAAATISWPVVTLNEDGTPYDDAGFYVVSVLLPNRSGTGWSAERIARTNTTFISGFTFGEALQARVATEDSSGNRSDWTYSPSVNLTGSTGPIPQAPDPVVESRMGQVYATWNGRDRNGSVLDPWIVGAEVHTSATPGFTVTDSTRVDLLATEGTAVVPGRQLGQLTYVKLVLIDYLGNRGTPSAEVSTIPSQIVSADIFDGAIGSAKLADLVVTTAKIANLAVNDAKIQSVSAGKITAGTLTADVILAAQIRTAAAGARVVLSNQGLQQFNSSNQTVVNVDVNGNATFSGSITAAEVTNYVRAISGTASVVINPTGILRPDSTLGPGIILSNGHTAERSPGALYTYMENLDANRKWIHVMMRTPGAYVPLTGSTNEQYSYIRISTVGRDSPYPSDQQLPAKITMGLGSPQSTIDFVPNLSTDSSVSARYPGFVLNGATPAGLRNNAGFLDAVNATGSAYVTMRGASFAAQSNERIKTDIVDFDFDVLDVLRANPSKQWRYRPEHTADQRLRLGPMADNMPEQLVARQGDDTFMDYGSELGFLWKTAEVLAARIQKLTERAA